MKFNVTIASPPGYKHAEAFREVAESVHYGLIALGYESSLEMNRFIPADGTTTILFGSNLLDPSITLPPRTILYNLEQSGSGWISQNLTDLFRKHIAWDYSFTNVVEFSKMKIHAIYAPIGYVPQLTRIAKSDHLPIDVLFYGSINERRQKIINDLRASGFSVRQAFGLYGKERDVLLSQSKIVLNLHYYPAHILEVPRVFYALANAKCVVSEASADQREWENSGIAFSAYDSIVQTCFYILQDRKRWQCLGKIGLEWSQSESRSAKGFLEQALKATEDLERIRKDENRQ